MSGVVSRKHRCMDHVPIWGVGDGDIWQCDCGWRWKRLEPGNPDYEGWRRTLPSIVMHRKWRAAT